MYIVQHKEQRIGIFVDVQNLYYSAKNLYHRKVNYKEILAEAVKGRSLIRAFAYVIKADMKDENSFHDALQSIGFEVKSKDIQIFHGGNKKGDWDVGIAMDAVRMTPKLDTIVLVSGDGDFQDLIEYVKAHGCRAEVIAFKSSCSSRLLDVVDQFTDMGTNSQRFLERSTNKQDSQATYQKQKKKPQHQKKSQSESRSGTSQSSNQSTKPVEQKQSSQKQDMQKSKPKSTPTSTSTSKTSTVAVGLGYDDDAFLDEVKKTFDSNSIKDSKNDQKKVTTTTKQANSSTKKDTQISDDKASTSKKAKKKAKTTTKKVKQTSDQSNEGQSPSKDVDVSKEKPKGFRKLVEKFIPKSSEEDPAKKK